MSEHIKRKRKLKIRCTTKPDRVFSWECYEQANFEMTTVWIFKQTDETWIVATQRNKTVIDIKQFDRKYKAYSVFEEVTKQLKDEFRD